MNFRWFEKNSVAERVGIHPTAMVGSDVSLEEGATVGPYCVIEGRVKIGAGSSILAHSIIGGTTLIGDGCRIGPNAVVGTDPQHHGYDGRETYLVIEDNVHIREFATVHRATKPGLENATRIGRGSLLMVGCHIAHDCRLGEHVTIANTVQLAGHVTVGDRAFVGGGTVIHQFCRIGRLAVIAGGEALSKDVLPFGAVFHGRHKGYNAIGCKRAGLDSKTIKRLRAAFRVIHQHRSAKHAAARLTTDGISESTIQELVDFIQISSRGIQPSSSALNGEAEFTA